MRQHLLGVVSVVAFLMSVGPGSAEGKLNVLAAFKNGDTEMDLATYSDVDGKGVEQRVGLVGLREGPRRNSAAFDSSDWPQFKQMWRRAEQTQVTGWTPIGQFTETGTSDVSTLRLSKGPSSYRIVIESPAKGAVNVEISQNDSAGVDAAIAKVDGFLAR